MITQEQIKATIERAEKQKQELQELIDSLASMEVEQEGRQEKGQFYWYIDNSGLISTDVETGDAIDDKRFDTGNYYLSKKEMLKTEQRVLLLRLLDRFSRQNGWTDEAWEDGNLWKWYIYRGQCGRTAETGFTRNHRDLSQVYFTSESVAQQAIEKYRDLIMEVMSI